MPGCLSSRPWSHLASDDLVFVVIVTVPLQGLQGLIALDSGRRLRAMLDPPWTRSHSDELLGSLWVLLALIACGAIVEVALGLASAKGAIMESSARRRVPLLFSLRLALLLPQLVAMVLTAFLLLRMLLAAASLSNVEHDWFGRYALKEIWFWELSIVLVAQDATMILTIVVIVVNSLTSTPLGLLLKIVRFALKLLGTHDSVVYKVAEIVFKTLHIGDVDLVPSDIIFGLLLVRNKQQLCRHSGDASAREILGGITSQIAASLDGGRLDGVTMPLSGECPADRKAMIELQRFLPYAVGIYGWKMQAFLRGVIPNTSCLSLCRAPCAFCNVLPCAHWDLPHRAVVEEDGPCGSFANANALLHCLAEDGSDIQLLFGTWRNRLGEPPPHCIVIDNTLKAVVLVVRGTLSLNDCVSDLLATPKVIEHMQQGEQEAFVHEGMYDCALGIIGRHKELLAQALGPGGPGDGYEMVCVGHSLGAGVAACAALELRRSRLLGDTLVRGICFEPPGGLFTDFLARETESFILSLVTADDWIPRLALRNVEILRERVLEEIAFCRSSKLQVAATEARGLVAVVFRSSAGALRSRRSIVDPRSFITSSRAEHPMNIEADRLITGRRKHHGEAAWWSPELYPPGRIVLLRSIEESSICCGGYIQSTAYRAEWLNTSSALCEIILTAKAMEYHAPNIFGWALENASKALQEQTLVNSNLDIELRSV